MAQKNYSQKDISNLLFVVEQMIKQEEKLGPLIVEKLLEEACCSPKNKKQMKISKKAFKDSINTLKINGFCFSPREGYLQRV